jgi:uncharacterized protein (DUF433 family)
MDYIRDKFKQKEGEDRLSAILRRLDHIRADIQDQIRIMKQTRDIIQWYEAKARHDELVEIYNILKRAMVAEYGAVEGYGRRRKYKKKGRGTTSSQQAMVNRINTRLNQIEIELNMLMGKLHNPALTHKHASIQAKVNRLLKERILLLQQLN